MADWDGSVSVQDGKILSLESWGFERNHRLDAEPRTWTCSTFVDNVRERSTFAEPFRGLLVELEVAGKTLLRVRTKQGEFTVRVAELTAGRPSRFLDDRAPVELPKPGTTQEPVAGHWVVRRGGEEYRVYSGDLHRHTDISRCYPTIDGCPVDAYRYASNAAGLGLWAMGAIPIDGGLN